MSGQKRILLGTPLFRFVMLITMMNTVLFLSHAKKPFTVSYHATPIAQMELLPALFSLMALTICFLEQSQRRRDQTIRLSALGGVTVLTLTYLLYLKTALHEFWNQEHLLLICLAILGLAVYTSLIIRND